MKKILIILFLITSQTTFANTKPLEFSEISFKDTKSDFIEIKINFMPEDEITICDDGKIAEISPSQISNEQYIVIHFKSEESSFKSENNILHIYTTKKGLTGTTEQITIESETTLIDAVCWENSSPTESELKDKNELIDAQAWQENCINSDEIEKNTSIYKSGTENTKESWQILKHPTPGSTNAFTNSAPIAKIEIQKGALQGPIPFSINLDGSNSYDPDGDALFYKWIYPDETFNTKNPKSYKIEKSGNYEISLTVTDEFGASDTEKIQITALNKLQDQQSIDLINKILEKQTQETFTEKTAPNTNWQYYLLIICFWGIVILKYI
jgi:hypothetical protein